MKLMLLTLFATVLLCGCDDDPVPTSDAGVDADQTESDGDRSDGDSSDGDAETEAGLGPLPPSPADSLGPYPIGVTTVELVDSARADRTLPVEVWYPAIHEAEARVARYTVEVNGMRIARVESPRGTVRDASPDRSAGPRPLIIFSHGSGGLRYQNVFQTEYLASHGFIVVAPDHMGNTMGDMMITENVEETLAQSAIDRPQDVSFILDQFTENIDEILPMLSPSIDPENIGITGHSFGGYTSIATTGGQLNLDQARKYCIDHTAEFACEMIGSLNPGEDPLSVLDERIKVSVPLAPAAYALFGQEGMSHVAVPTLIQAGDSDQRTPLELDQQPMFDGITEVPVWLVVYEDAGHLTFTDLCMFVDIIGKAALKMIGMLDSLQDGCSPENVDYLLAQEVINTLATAFFQIHLQDHAQAEDSLIPGDFYTIRSQGNE